jgi:hypothetical protein
VRNLLLPFIEVTSLGASGSGIPPQGASGSSIPVDWESVVLAYHHRELIFPANLWIGSQQFWHTRAGGSSKPMDKGNLQYSEMSFKECRRKKKYSVKRNFFLVPTNLLYIFT